MPLLNFHKKFASGVRASIDEIYRVRSKEQPKRTTIRTLRKRKFKEGDVLHLYTGLRTRNCHKLGEVICIKAELCVILMRDDRLVIRLDHRELDWKEIIKIAYIDGFPVLAHFVDFFKTTYGLPFVGQRITWKSTYNRKYYLNKKVKESGFDLNIENTAKTIMIPSSKALSASSDKYIKELQKKHSYGAQINLEF